MSGEVFDFDKLAAAFDQFLPVLAPVTGGLADRLPALAEGTSVLDIASGTGEPSLTLARRHPGIRVLGIDAAAPMVDIARRKAAAMDLADVDYQVMSSDALALPDAGVDVVVSRFGALSFADPLAETREILRVLRPGGSFSIATWDAGSKNILTYAIGSAAGSFLPPAVVSAVQRLEQFAMPGRREAWLTKAGMSVVESELFAWPVEFTNEAEMWDLAVGPAILGAILGELSPESRLDVRREFVALLADYQRADGTYILPYACRLIWGRR